MSGEPRWIVVPKWEEFQHRDAARVDVPTWIKFYTRLLSDEDYLSLPFHTRGVLHGLWLEYARSRRQLPDNTATLTRRLGQRVLRRDLDALNHAGYIAFSASRDAGRLAGTEKRRIEESTLAKGSSGAPASNEPQRITNPLELVGVAPIKRKPHDPRARRSDGTSTYTGCRRVRGSHGAQHIVDPLGIDLPPADWPHKPPTAAEVARALEARRKIVHRDPNDDSGYALPKGWEA